MEATTLVGNSNAAAANAEIIPLASIAPSSSSNVDESPISEKEFQAQHDAIINELKKDTGLVGYITGEWDLARTYRMSNGIDTKMLLALTARQGQYDVERLAVINAIGGSDIYDRILTECCRTAETFINDAISSDGTPWRFVAARQNKIPEYRQKAFKQKVQQDWIKQSVASGAALDTDTTVDMFKQAYQDELETIHEENEAKIHRMEDLCYDQFREGGGWQALNEFIKDLVLYKAACIRGPIATPGYQLEFKQNALGVLKPTSKKVMKYTFSRVCPWDLFPFAGNEKMAKGKLVVRCRYEANDLLENLGQDGWYDDAIRATVERYGEDGVQYFTSFDSTQKWLEEHGTWLGSRKGVIECLEYWGYCRGDRLKPNSLTKTESIKPDGWYHIHAIICQTELLFCALMDDRYDRVPIFADSFSRIAGSAWGEGIKDLIDDKEAMICACQRSLADNMGFSSGPIMVVDYSQLPAGQKIERPTPRAIYQISAENGKTCKPIEFQLIPSNSQDLLKVYESMRSRVYDMIGMAPPDMEPIAQQVRDEHRPDSKIYSVTETKGFAELFTALTSM